MLLSNDGIIGIKLHFSIRDLLGMFGEIFGCGSELGPHGVLGLEVVLGVITPFWVSLTSDLCRRLDLGGRGKVVEWDSRRVFLSLS